LPQGRRKGVARALMIRAMEGMRHYKAKLCYLEVRVTNEPGVTLYKKLDFEVSRTINGYYSDNEDAYVMTKKL
jgi:ribosomal-protein-alanine N-acetyltransferase